MNDPSHKSSSKYKVDYKKYSSEWQRIFGDKKEITNENYGQPQTISRDE